MKFSLAVLTLFVGLLLIWFFDGGKRDPELPEKKDEVAVGDSEHGPERHETHSNGLLPAIEREPGARSSIGTIEEFEEWMGRFLPADSSGRDQLIEEGVAVAGRRREELKRLIQEDPEAALALAVPYEFRRELPPEITGQLETPVSNFAQYRLVHYDWKHDHAGHSHSESVYERIAKFGGNRYQVHTFGNRFNVTTKDLLSIHGIAIDGVLAMVDDPIRDLSESERADRGFEGNIVVSVGGNVYGASDEEAVRRLRQILEEDEGSLGPQPAAGYRALQREEVEGVSLLLAQEPDEDIDFADLSEAQSAPHTIGPKTMLYIRVRFSDQAEDFEPIDLETLKVRQALCEKFWFENSYGKSSLTTTFADTITLPETFNYYENNYYQLGEDAVTLVKAAGEAKGEDWDSENYDFHTVLTPEGDWRYSGLAGVGARDSLLFGPDASNVSTPSHEFGHNLGLWHANYWRTDSTSPIGRDSIPGGYVGDEEGDEWNEYGHRFSVMSSQDNHGYFTEGRAHYTTGEKVVLDWLVAEDGDWMSVDQTTATPIRLYRHDVEADEFDAMLTGVPRAIKINLDSGDYAETDKRRYWLSYRLLPTVLPFGDWLPYGLQVDWQRETYGPDGSILLDMTPYTDDERGHIDNKLSPHYVDTGDKGDGVVVIGRTYSDEVADIHFTPIARGGETPNEWIDVLINIGTQDENTPPKITSLTASSTEVAPGEIVNFSVDAEDQDGDTLYYTWTFYSLHHTLDIENLNSKTVSKSFGNAWRKSGNLIPVRVTVSDGKGGSDSKAINVIVGDFFSVPTISGRVTSGGSPVEGAIVKSYSDWVDEEGGYTSEHNAWTDSEGRYFFLHTRDTESWLTVLKDGFRFRPLFPNPVYLAESEATGRDWVGFPNETDRTPEVHLTSPNFPVAIVPEGSGLFLEAGISDDHFPNSSGKPEVRWSVLEAPEGGAVAFSPPTGLATVATFSIPGYYTILISATNAGLNTGTREIYVNAGLNSNDNPTSADAQIYFSLDEREGITVTDSRGGDNNGRLVNGAGWTGPDGGISGTGIVLDGIDDQIHLDIDSDIIKGRTIALWFKADDPLRENKQVIYHDYNRRTGLIIYLEAGRLYVGGWTNEANDWHEIYLSTELIDTNWHHVALAMKDFSIGSSAYHEIKGFLDGLEFGSDVGGGGEGNFIFWLSTRITLGAHSGSNSQKTWYHDGPATGPGDHFAGIVDEFHLWDWALTLQEVGQIFRKFYLGPDVFLSSVDHLAGSVVVPPGMGIVLDGSVKGNGSLKTRWETVIVPESGEAIFDNPAHPSTVATFSTPGYYKLRLSADDGLQKSAIDVDVHAGLEAGSNFSSPQELVYYSMDEGSGTTVGNSADGSRPGSLSNPSSWTSEGGGIAGNALQFDGNEEYLELGNHFPTTKSPNAKSFALWMKPNEIGTGEKEVVFQKSGRYGGLYIYLDGNVLYFGGRNDTEIRWNSYLPVPITRGRWHHVALVFDPDESGLHHDGLRAYLNGRQVASGLVESGIDLRKDRGTLGRQLDGSHFHDGFSRRTVMNTFSGIVDEFHYYQDHALTIDEIGMLYAFGNVGPTVDAGPDQLDVPPFSRILLEGSSTDDGRWSSPLTYFWYILDGPGGDGGFRLLESNGASVQLENLEGGSYRFALGAYDGQVTTFDEMTVTVRHPTQFELFMRDFPAIAVEDRSYHADPDGDNRSNLAEYALGGAPDVSETYYQLGLRYELVREAGHWYAEFRYPQRRDAAQRGLRYAFEVSDDLSTDSWMDRGYTVLNITPMDEVFEEVHLTMDEPLDSANSRLFGRVRVEIRD